MTAVTPSEAAKKTGDHIPTEVIEIINELVVENSRVTRVNDVHGAFTNIRSRVYQKDIVNRIKSRIEDAYDSSWLDFEEVFRRAGWTVAYDKPGYNESYDAYFDFSARMN